MKSILSAILLTSMIAAKAQASLIFADSVPADQKATLTSDLLSLAQSGFVKDEKLAAMLGVSQSDGLSIVNWIDNRVNYIVGENFDLKANTVVVSPSYPFADSPLPPIENVKPKPQGTTKLYVLMSNIGASLYVKGKRERSLIGVSVNNQTIEIRSPRTGLFQVGNGMFTNAKEIGIGTKNVESARAMRLAVLLHEARHSDGRGETSGFFHRVCPEGHRLAGTISCDANSNGPYGVEARFLKDYIKQCRNCTALDKEYLRKLLLDVSSRLALKTSDQPGDASPEGDFSSVSKSQTWSMIYWLGK